MTTIPKKQSTHMNLASVKTRKVDWLWYPYVPLGALTMLHGRGAVGKSHITASIAAIVSKGLPFPGSNVTGPDQKVLILSAEDDLEVILAPRLRDMDAKMTNIHVPTGEIILDLLGLRALEALIDELKPALVVIDPIVYYIGSRVDMNKANEVRAVLKRLQDIAKRHNLAILIVAHDRKAKPGDRNVDQDAMSGSADFRNASRSSLGVSKLPEGGGHMVHDKFNWSPKGATFPYDWVDNDFEWGEPVDEEELGLDTPTGRPREIAAAWLKNLLKNGRVKATEVDIQAKALNISKKTLDRAKTGIAYSEGVMENGVRVWYWVPGKAIARFGNAEKKQELKLAKESAKGFTDANEAEVHDVDSRGPDTIQAPGRGGKLVDPSDAGEPRGNRQVDEPSTVQSDRLDRRGSVTPETIKAWIKDIEAEAEGMNHA